MHADGAFCPKCKEERTVALVKEDAPQGKCHHRSERCHHITGAKCLTCGHTFGLESPFKFKEQAGV